MNKFKKLLFILCAFKLTLFHGLCGTIESNFSEWTLLYEGVEYRLVQKESPSRLRVHIVRIDMNNPDVKFRVTPSEEGMQTIRSMKTSSFLEKYHVQLAINGTGYLPAMNETEGSLKSIEAFAVGNGEQYAETNEENGAFIILKNGKAKIVNSEELDAYKGEIAEGLGGWKMDGGALLLVEGEIKLLRDGEKLARTAIGLNKKRNNLFLVVVEGGPKTGFFYKDWISMGVTMKELAVLMSDLGCYWALNLDNSGASTMVISDMDHKALVLNVPSDYRESVERSVGNHFGVYAKRLNDDCSIEKHVMLKKMVVDHYKFIKMVQNTGSGLKHYQWETNYCNNYNINFTNKEYCELRKINFLYLSKLKLLKAKPLGVSDQLVFRDENEVVWFVKKSEMLAKEYLGSKLMNLLIGPLSPESRLLIDAPGYIGLKYILRFVEQWEIRQINKPIVGKLKLDLAMDLLGMDERNANNIGYINEDDKLVASRINFENSFKFDWNIDEENIYQETLYRHSTLMDKNDMKIAIEELLAIPDYYIFETLSEGISDLLATESGLELDIDEYKKLGHVLTKRKQQLYLIYEDF